MQEEAKRSEYDEIIYGLLDKTCENAANALRRRVYWVKFPEIMQFWNDITFD